MNDCVTECFCSIKGQIYSCDCVVFIKYIPRKYVYVYFIFGWISLLNIVYFFYKYISNVKILCYFPDFWPVKSCLIGDVQRVLIGVEYGCGGAQGQQRSYYFPQIKQQTWNASMKQEYVFLTKDFHINKIV